MINKKQKPKGFLRICALIALAALLCKCKKDEAVTPAASTNVITADTTLNSLSATNSLSSTATYNITSALPSGYVKNGTKDYTSYIQAALKKYTNVTFPAFPIMINDAGLVIGSNTTITFLAGSKLILKPTSSGDYNILRIQNASNVTLINPVIVGDRYNHLSSSTGEWGQGIGIYGSSYVTITGANVTNCWGDGIYLASTNSIGNKNITITNASCVYNRRNGISVTNVVGLVLNAPYAAHCDGTAPFTGIDFEAGSSKDNLQNITINNASTEHNVGNGISIGFRNLYGGSNKTIGFTLNNPADKGSAVAFKTTATLTKRVGSETVTGNINIVTPSWRMNATSPIQENLLVNTIKVSISKPAVENMNSLWLSQSQVLSLLTYKTNMLVGSNYAIKF